MTERSYPYPVVGNRDDVTEADFQATIDVAFDSETAFIDVEARTSSKTLETLIATGKAQYCLHIECSNTLFRYVHCSQESKFRAPIALNVINNLVEANVSIIATEPVAAYRVDGQHRDYGDHTFAVRKGDVLAVFPTLRFDVERDYATLQRIDSVVRVVAGDDADGSMTIDVDQDKLMVVLCKQDFRAYGKLMHSPLASVLGPTIILPALVEAIRLLKDDDNCEIDTRWARLIRAKLGEKVKGSDEALTLAQELLELPIRRALIAADMALDAGL